MLLAYYNRKFVAQWKLRSLLPFRRNADISRTSCIMILVTALYFSIRILFPRNLTPTKYQWQMRTWTRNIKRLFHGEDLFFVSLLEGICRSTDNRLSLAHVHFKEYILTLRDFACTLPNHLKGINLGLTKTLTV